MPSGDDRTDHYSLVGQETQLRDSSLSQAIYVATVHHNTPD